MRRYYEVLGLSEDANEKQIKAAYRRMASKHHPDKNPDDPEAPIRFKEIKEAYDCLIDPENKLLYDETGDPGLSTGDPNEDLLTHIMNRAAELETVSDILSKTQYVLEEMIEEIEDRLPEQDKLIAEYEAKVTKLVFRGKGNNLLDAILKDKLDTAKQDFTHLSSGLKAARGAIEMLKDYIALDHPTGRQARHDPDAGDVPSELNFLRAVLGQGFKDEEDVKDR